MDGFDDQGGNLADDTGETVTLASDAVANTGEESRGQIVQWLVMLRVLLYEKGKLMRGGKDGNPSIWCSNRA